jgi:DNA invertase Pin-like site-specific DNA recombinase
MKAAIYARVSTLLGQDPENQLAPLRQLAAVRKFTVTGEFVDKGQSGAKERRPALDELVKAARKGAFKVILISGIDRLARDTRHLLNLIHELEACGVALISIRENIDFTSPMGKAVLAVLGAMAALERDLIAERVKVALAVGKEKAQKAGRRWKHGRPPALTEGQLTQARKLRAAGHSIRKIAAALGGKVSSTAVHRALKVTGG